MKRRKILVYSILVVILTSLFFILKVNIQENTQQNNIKIIEKEFDIVYGVEEAPLTIFLFTNYGCKFCRKFFTESFDKLKREYIDTKKVKLVIKLVDLTSDKSVTNSLMLSVCINQCGNLKPMDNLLLSDPSVVYTNEFTGLIEDFIDKNNYISECMLSGKSESYIINNLTDFKVLSLTGTPTFVMNKRIYNF